MDLVVIICSSIASDVPPCNAAAMTLFNRLKGSRVPLNKLLIAFRAENAWERYLVELLGSSDGIMGPHDAQLKRIADGIALEDDFEFDFDVFGWKFDVKTCPDKMSFPGIWSSKIVPGVVYVLLQTFPDASSDEPFLNFSAIGWCEAIDFERRELDGKMLFYCPREKLKPMHALLRSLIHARGEELLHA